MSIDLSATLPTFQTSAGGTSSASSAKSSRDDGWDFSFKNLLDIVNPLQHLPVIGTLYRAITGDSIATPEKIAGDALYGGLWGFVSSLADTAFQAVTGKNFGDTMLALVSGDHAKPAAAQASMQLADNAIATPDIASLSGSLARSGVDSDTAQRAIFAYRRSIGMTSALSLAAAN